MKHTALSWILQLSRLLGVAPFIRAPEYQVSRAIDVCGRIVITCFSIVIGEGILNYTLLNKKSVLLTMDLMRIGSRLSVVIIAMMGVYTAAGRITRIAEFLKQLEQIELNVPCRGKQSNKRKIFYVVFTYIAITFLVRFTRLVNRMIYESEYTISKSINLLEYNIVTILEMQLVILATRVLHALETINYNLEKLIVAQCSIPTPNTKPTAPRVAWEDMDNFKTNILKSNKHFKLYRKNVENRLNIDSPDANVALKIRQLAKHYINICEIVRSITKRDGFLMILLLICHMLHVELAWHQIIIWITNFRNTLSFAISPIIHGSMHTIALLLCMEPFHHTHVQMDHTHLVINYLKCRRADEEEVRNELEMFMRLLVLNKTTYSPLRMCTLARPLAFKIFGSLVTYLVILLTYGPEMTYPSLVISGPDAFV